MDKEKIENARNSLRQYSQKNEKCQQAKALGAVNKPLERELADVDYRLSCIPENQSQILKWFYIDKLGRKEVAQKLNLSQAHTYRKKDDALYVFAEMFQKRQNSRIAVKDISVGRYVKVHRHSIGKVSHGDARFKPSLKVGIICYIPEHKRFCTVQFFNPHTGKPIYKESFFWRSIALINRPIGFKGELAERVE